jgi:hypothetical protein
MIDRYVPYQRARARYGQLNGNWHLISVDANIFYNTTVDENDFTDIWTSVRSPNAINFFFKEEQDAIMFILKYKRD